jgi:hypothetical protein
MFEQRKRLVSSSSVPRQQQRACVEPMEPRVLFSGNLVSGLLAIVGVLDPKSVQSQPGGYDPKIGLVPFTQK